MPRRYVFRRVIELSIEAPDERGAREALALEPCHLGYDHEEFVLVGTKPMARRKPWAPAFGVGPAGTQDNATMRKVGDFWYAI